MLDRMVPTLPARALTLAFGIALAAACGGDRGGDDSAGAAGDGEGAAARWDPALCDQNPGITLPAGFCATIFADSTGSPRHLTVAPNGDVFVALARPRGGQGEAAGGGVLALRDTNRDGRADVRRSFGKPGGTGIGLAGGWLYHDQATEIVRYPIAANALEPSGAPETIVRDMPTGGHAARNLVLDGASLFVNFGSRTNACQVADRQRESRGVDPCTELEQRAGIWRFDANRQAQAPRDGERFATGIRNAVGMARHPGTGRLWAAQHGRDQLLQNWPKLFTAEESAEKPAEELMEIARGDDYGWPYCYYDPQLRKLVLAPEYGGDGEQVGRCAEKKDPVAYLPAHYAPNALHFYAGRQFPARYRDGAFVAFHGSWNRAPLPQAGYQVGFVPLGGERPATGFEPFAGGLVGEGVQPGTAVRRPTGLAESPDGSLYITDDAGGRIWQVHYTGR
jgi:glucose/arabinose dehydrogenase